MNSSLYRELLFVLRKLSAAKFTNLHSASARFFHPKDGVWMVDWMRYQIFIPILLLQFLNLFWYYLMCRILYR